MRCAVMPCHVMLGDVVSCPACTDACIHVYTCMSMMYMYLVCLARCLFMYMCCNKHTSELSCSSVTYADIAM